VAFNGTLLHELYFENLAAPGQKPTNGFKRGIELAFGSFDAWIEDVKACLASAHGWCLTVYDLHHSVIRNNLVGAEHHVGLFPNCVVLLAVDAWEHAYLLDYGTRKDAYASAILGHLNYGAVEQRLTLTPLGSNHRARK